MPEGQQPTPLSNAELVAARIEELQEKLRASQPGYESLLHTIHTALSKDQDVVHLLTDEQIGVICAGLAKRTSVVIAESVSKSRSSGGKKLKDIGLGDL